MPESGSGPTQARQLIDPPPGWERVEGVGEPVNIFEVDSRRPDFPEKWRSRAEMADRERLSRDPATLRAIARLRDDFAKLDMDRVIDAFVRGVEIRESVGNPEPAKRTGYLLDHIWLRVREAVEQTIPEGVPYTVALRYFTERTLPVELHYHVFDEVPSPLKLTVNAEPGKRLLMTIMPGEAIIRFRGIARRDINRIGHFITEAIDLQSPDRPKGGRGGRRAIDESPDDMATAELVARLFHWEEWSQRRIAAFLGWLKPTDDWSDAKTRARIEQRVRRWLRIGEAALAIVPDDADDTNADHDSASWKRRPAHLEAAVRADDRKRERR